MKADFSSPEAVLRSISQLILKRSYNEFSRKQKRAFHRLVSGLTRSHFRGERLRFMTLTGSVLSDAKRLSRDFQVLRNRIEHAFGFRLQYWKINTNEGNGVIHCVFKGLFVPQAWLSNAWHEIHGAPIVDIRVLRNKPRRLANYLVSHYLSRQSFERMSWSWHWVYPGFCRDWASEFASWYKRAPSACLKAWNYRICHYVNPVPLVQGRLGG